MVQYEGFQNGMVVAWERVARYGHKLSDLVVTFVQKDLQIDPKKWVNQDGWRVSSFAVSCIVPLAILFFMVNLVMCVCCGRRRKEVPLVKLKEEKKEEILEQLPPPARKKLRVPRIDLLDKVYSQLEAMRWMRQARLDVRSAANDLKADNGAFEWVCFKCQQAAEKALKACLISNELQAVNIRSHDLCELAIATKDNELIQIATRLQIIIGFVGEMRYPDYLPYPKIPNEIYTIEQATRVMGLTRVMLEVISEKSFNEVDVMTADLSTGDRMFAPEVPAGAQKTQNTAECSDS